MLPTPAGLAKFFTSIHGSGGNCDILDTVQWVFLVPYGSKIGVPCTLC
jgi:hypothetical protein